MSLDATQAPPAPPAAHRIRQVIHATCTRHGGARGFANLVVAKSDGGIVLDSHVTGACVLVLDEAAATELRDQLMEWRG